MNLIVVMAVYNEEDLIGQALDSLTDAGVDRVAMFDGAWRGGKNGDHHFGPTPGSTDRTLDIADRWAHATDTFLMWRTGTGVGPDRLDDFGFWPSQEEKRTALFQDVGARSGDWLFVMDADETLHGRFDKDRIFDAAWQAGAHAAHIDVRCVGGNDLPGIRGEWPNGDYSPDYKPELRLFRWTPDLECVYPGGYWQNGEIIQAYTDAAGTPALPVLNGIRMDHHGAARSPDRIAQKIAYYNAEHPERAKWQRAFSRAGR